MKHLFRFSWYFTRALSTGLMVPVFVCSASNPSIKHQEPLEPHAPRGERSPGRWQKKVKGRSGTRSYQVSRLGLICRRPSVLCQFKWFWKKVFFFYIFKSKYKLLLVFLTGIWPFVSRAMTSLCA